MVASTTGIQIEENYNEEYQEQSGFYEDGLRMSELKETNIKEQTPSCTSDDYSESDYSYFQIS